MELSQNLSVIVINLYRCFCVTDFFILTKNMLRHGHPGPSNNDVPP